LTVGAGIDRVFRREREKKRKKKRKKKKEKGEMDQTHAAFFEGSRRRGMAGRGRKRGRNVAFREIRNHCPRVKYA